MDFDLRIFEDPTLQSEFVEWLVEQYHRDIEAHFAKLWDYYANPTCEQVLDLRGESVEQTHLGRVYVQAQEYGLPARITGLRRCAEAGIFSGLAVKNVQRKEVCIENDIAWRINAGVDFLFGRPISFVSRSPDGQKRAEIETIIKALFGANGSIGFFQDMAVLGSVYGFVDCLIRPGEEILARALSDGSSFRGSPLGESLPPLEKARQLAQTIELELIDPPRALPVLDENDYRKIRYYVQQFSLKKNTLAPPDWSGGLAPRPAWGFDTRATSDVTEIISERAWQRYENGQIVAQASFPWGFLPLVHIQNIAQPYYYEGVSDVEPLIPLQDELNTRLSDRANRITMQSFKMYLGKGIEGFQDRPISPGRMWHTDNPDASIEEFGGDQACPSEAAHIAEVREAMDKISGVTPVVAGLLQNKIGNLTSAVALRMTLMGTLSKNERKRLTYGAGLKKIVNMVLAILDKAAIFSTSAEDRDIEIIFPSPLPENTMEKLKEAQIKKDLGIPTAQVLRELGYEELRM